MTERMTRPQLIAAAKSFLADPRFVTALTTVAVATAVCSYLLRQTIGWAGLIGILAVLVMLASGSILAKRSEIEWQGLLPISLLLFVGLAGLSIVWSEYQWATLGGTTYLYAYTVLAVAIALTRDTIQIVRAFGDVFRVVLTASLALEIISGLLIDAPLKFLAVEGNLGSLGPIQGIMGSRNQLGLVGLLALISFGIEFATKSISRTTAGASLIVASTSILLSRSPVILAVLVAVIAAGSALYLVRKVEPDRRRAWQLGILAATVVLAASVWAFREPVIGLFSASSELTYRLTHWQHIVELSTIHPLEGWGWIGLWQSDLSPFSTFAVHAGKQPTSALSAYLDVWLQLGLIGLLVFVVLLVLTFTRSWLLAGQRRSIVFAWPALALVALIGSSLAESSMLIEYGWLTFVVCSVKAARELSWRRAFVRASSMNGSL